MTLSLAPKSLAATTAGLLAVGSAVALGTTAATAVEVSLTTSYTCTSPLLGTATFSGTLSLDMPTSVPSASTVPSRPVDISVTIPSETLDGKRPPIVNSISGTATAMSYRVGSQLVPVTNASIPSTPVPASGPMTVETTATAGSFVAQAPATYAVKVPQTFTVNATAQTFAGPVQDTIQCQLANGAPDLLGNLTVTAITKVASTTAVKVTNKPITTKKKAKLAVTVTAIGNVPTGKVTAKLGKKLLRTGTLTSGKVTLKLPKLSRGKKTIVVRYKGDLKVKPSKKAVTFTVRRG